ncbi:hypothetical protein LIA77_10969 [Sarocladium implicatum]|nr:hypothetical protein LIA77_10969 [Sarocladium implicatum]
MDGAPPTNSNNFSWIIYDRDLTLFLCGGSGSGLTRPPLTWESGVGRPRFESSDRDRQMDKRHQLKSILGCTTTTNIGMKSCADTPKNYGYAGHAVQAPTSTFTARTAGAGAGIWGWSCCAETRPTAYTSRTSRTTRDDLDMLILISCFIARGVCSVAMFSSRCATSLQSSGSASRGKMVKAVWAIPIPIPIRGLAQTQNVRDSPMERISCRL